MKNNDFKKVSMEDATSSSVAALSDCPEKPSSGIRYFKGASENEGVKTNLIMTSDDEVMEDDQNTISTKGMNSAGECFRKRPKIGDLPAFIPL